MQLSVLEWNIHQQGGKGKGEIPPWVIDEIVGTDIIILTEFTSMKYETKRNDFINELMDKGYDCRASENIDGNDVLIAVRDCYKIEPFTFEPCYGVAGAEAIPENCRVDIRVGEKTLTVFGVRIKDFGVGKNPTEKKRIWQANMRKTQFDWFLTRLNEEPPQGTVLIGGDFNNYRRLTDVEQWNMDVLCTTAKKHAELTMYTPSEDGSIYEEYKPYPKQFAEDHFLVRGGSLTVSPYDRDFTCRLGREKDYPQGRDLVKIKPGIPDHAILRGTLTL